MEVSELYPFLPKEDVKYYPSINLNISLHDRNLDNSVQEFDSCTKPARHR
jgi:hypothetical protein